MITIEAKAGEDIWSLVRTIVMCARNSGKRTGGIFNGHLLVADPTSIERDVYDQWDVDQRRSYFGESDKFGTRSN